MLVISGKGYNKVNLDELPAPISAPTVLSGHTEKEEVHPPVVCISGKWHPFHIGYKSKFSIQDETFHSVEHYYLASNILASDLDIVIDILTRMWYMYCLRRHNLV